MVNRLAVKLKFSVHHYDNSFARTLLYSGNPLVDTIKWTNDASEIPGSYLTSLLLLVGRLGKGLKWEDNEALKIENRKLQFPDQDA